jgi:hypothetical protein
MTESLLEIAAAESSSLEERFSPTVPNGSQAVKTPYQPHSLRSRMLKESLLSRSNTWAIKGTGHFAYTFA